LGHIRAEESITVEEAVPRMIHLSRNENAPLIGRGPRGFEKKIKAVEATEAEGFLLSKQPKKLEQPGNEKNSRNCLWWYVFSSNCDPNRQA
jgi:hypothetical protein